MGNLEESGGVASCPSCGFAAPRLDVCRLTGLCAQCSRARLPPSTCASCPDRARCDMAVEGIGFLKRLEPRLDIYVDLAKAVAARLERYGRVELGLAFVKSLMGLVKLLERVGPQEAFPAWVSALLAPGVMERLLAAPYLVELGLGAPFRRFCQAFGCAGLEGPLENLLEALVSLSLLEGRAEPEAYLGL